MLWYIHRRLAFATLIVTILAARLHMALAEDCNQNNIADECDVACGPPGGACDLPGCGRRVDCNGNSTPDECELTGPHYLPVHVNMLGSAMSLVPTAGDYPPGLFAATWNGVFHIGLDGTVSSFNDASTQAGVFAPAGFLENGFSYFTLNYPLDGSETSTIHHVSPDGSDAHFADIPGGVAYGLVYVPIALGGPAAGKLVACACVYSSELLGVGGALYAIDGSGHVTLLRYLDFCAYDIVATPAAFGTSSNQLLIGSAIESTIVAVDPVDLKARVFTKLIVPEPVADNYGLRRMAFSPVGWGSAIAPETAEETVLLVIRNLDSERGTVEVFDSAGRRVGRLLNTGPAPTEPVDPWSVAFSPDGNSLIARYFPGVHDADAVVRVTVHDFVTGDCNGNSIPDDCDLSSGAEVDCNLNGVPESCEFLIDCNHNALPDSCDIQAGLSLDSDGDGLPNECELRIVGSDPPNGAIDARQPYGPDSPGVPTGWRSIRIYVDNTGTTEVLVVADFAVVQEGGALPPPEVIFVDPLIANLQATVILDRPIEPGAWTIITHIGSQTSVRIGLLPGDVNGDRRSGPLDILALIDSLNGTGKPRPIFQTDINRNGTADPSDVLRLIDLLNGAAGYPAFNGAVLPD